MKIFKEGEHLSSKPERDRAVERYLGEGAYHSRIVYETESPEESNLASMALTQCAQRGIGPSSLITFGVHPLRMSVEMAHYLHEGLAAMSKDSRNGKSARDLFIDISRNLAELSLRAALNPNEPEISMPIIPPEPEAT